MIAGTERALAKGLRSLRQSHERFEPTEREHQQRMNVLAESAQWVASLDTMRRALRSQWLNTEQVERLQDRFHELFDTHVAKLGELTRGMAEWSGGGRAMLLALKEARGRAGRALARQGG
jgi:hypothetical protein